MSTLKRLPPVLRPTVLCEQMQRRRASFRNQDDAARRLALAALNRTARLALAGALAAGTLARAVEPAAAEPSGAFTVTTLADSGMGSLRQAVLDAVSSDGVDTIGFSAGLTGQITLTSGEINIDSSVNIVGPGVDVLTVASNGSGRVFLVGEASDTATLDVSISGLTISGGGAVSPPSYGGGVYNRDENLTLDNVLITGNTADLGGGIYTHGPGGSLMIKNSTISNNRAVLDGGGLAVGTQAPGASGTDLTIQNSIITGNTAGYAGGGVYINLPDPYYSAMIERSTISGNTAGDEYNGAGGGIGFGQLLSPVTIRQVTISDNTSYDGGGIHLDSNNENLVIENTTISGNTAINEGGGIFVYINSPYGGTFNIRSTTIAANQAGTPGGGGGIMHKGSDPGVYNDLDPHIVLTNTIIANNTAGTATTDLAYGAHGRFDLNYSLLEVSPGGSGIALTTNNIVGQDPKLGPLAENSGPTRTHMPAADSPAVNAGNSAAAPATDQRGLPRIFDGRVDIGAVERSFYMRLPITIRSAAALLAGAVSSLLRFWGSG